MWKRIKMFLDSHKDPFLNRVPSVFLRSNPEKRFDDSRVAQLPHMTLSLTAKEGMRRTFQGQGDLIHDYRSESVEGDPVVIDESTGLMWQRSGTPNSCLVREALKQILSLNYNAYAGFKDWRLPTLEEAATLIEPQAWNGVVYIDPVFDSWQTHILSGDRNLQYVWYVDFQYRSVANEHQSQLKCFLRAVRSLAEPVKPASPLEIIETYATERLGRTLKPDELNTIRNANLQTMCEGVDNFVHDADSPYELECVLREREEEMHQRFVKYISENFQQIESVLGRPLNPVEQYGLQRLENISAFKEYMQQLGSADDPCRLFEISLSQWSQPHLPKRIKSIQYQGKQVSGGRFFFLSLERDVNLSFETSNGLQDRVNRFWDNFEHLKPQVQQILSQVLPEDGLDWKALSGFESLHSLFFKVLNLPWDDVEMSFETGTRSYLVGIVENKVAYVDRCDPPKGTSRKRLWGKGGGRIRAMDRWKIEFVTLRSRDSYLESDCQYEYRVIHRKTGKVFKTFWRDEYQNSQGSHEDGVRNVSFSEDGNTIIALYEDGHKETVTLPPDDPDEKN